MTEPIHGQKVQVYFNLHRKTFSVQALTGPNKGRVIVHVDRFEMLNATFVVRKGGRERVLKEQRKNVHAFVKGDWVDDSRRIKGTPEGKCSYDPYKADTFMTERGKPIYEALAVFGKVVDRKATLGYMEYGR